MARPKGEEMIQTGLRLTKPIHEELMAAAAEEGRSVNAQVTVLVKAYLETRKRSERAKQARREALAKTEEA